jgi:hypothetical protein
MRDPSAPAVLVEISRPEELQAVTSLPVRTLLVEISRLEEFQPPSRLATSDIRIWWILVRRSFIFSQDLLLVLSQSSHAVSGDVSAFRKQAYNIFCQLPYLKVLTSLIILFSK